MEKNAKMNEGTMQLAVASMLNYVSNIIVPNISHGFLPYEADLLCLDSKNRITEVEIKISNADLKNDFKKKNFHNADFVSRLAYAVTEDMVDLAKEIIPEHIGIIVVKQVMATYSTSFSGKDNFDINLNNIHFGKLFKRDDAVYCFEKIPGKKALSHQVNFYQLGEYEQG